MILGTAIFGIVVQPQAYTWGLVQGSVIFVVLIAALGVGCYCLGRRKPRGGESEDAPLVDPVTGIYNRKGVAQIAQGLFANTEIKRGACVILMDLDYFKSVNESYGLEAGDAIIKTAAATLQRVIRNGDFIGRWSGAKFILLCASSTPQGARHLGEKIRSAIACEDFLVEGRAHKLTLSAGVALATDGESFEAVLKRAAIALEDAKANGRNRIALAWKAAPGAVATMAKPQA